MTAREKTAWVAFGVTAAALAAVLIFPWHAAAPARSDTRARVATQDASAQLDRIERRLERLESAQHISGADARSTDETNQLPPALQPSPPQIAPDPDATSTIAVEQNRLAGAAVVDRAIRAGYWSRKDTEAWMAAAGGMRGEDRFELHRRLIVEINADRLEVEPGVSVR